MSEKLWVIYDERAILEGTDEATVLVSAQSWKEAQRDARDFALDYGCVVIYEYDVKPGTNELINETQRKIVSLRESPR